MLATSANATRARVDYERRRSSRQRQSIIRQGKKQSMFVKQIIYVSNQIHFLIASQQHCLAQLDFF